MFRSDASGGACLRRCHRNVQCLALTMCCVLARCADERGPKMLISYVPLTTETYLGFTFGSFGGARVSTCSVLVDSSDYRR